MVVARPPLFPDGIRASYGKLMEQQRDCTARLKSYLPNSQRNSNYVYPDYNGLVIYSKDPRQLAYEGFRFTGIFDISECTWCFLRVEHWDADDDVREIHKETSPDCPFLKTIGRPDDWMRDVWTSSARELYGSKEARIVTFAAFDFLTLEEKTQLASAMFYAPAQADGVATLECLLCESQVKEWDGLVESAISKHACEVNAVVKSPWYVNRELPRLRPLPHRVKK